jgi:hypothetical protein
MIIFNFLPSTPRSWKRSLFLSSLPTNTIPPPYFARH